MLRGVATGLATFEPRQYQHCDPHFGRATFDQAARESGGVTVFPTCPGPNARIVEYNADGLARARSEIADRESAIKSWFGACADFYHTISGALGKRADDLKASLSLVLPEEQLPPYLGLFGPVGRALAGTHLPRGQAFWGVELLTIGLKTCSA